MNYDPELHYRDEETLIEILMQIWLPGFSNERKGEKEYFRDMRKSSCKVLTNASCILLFVTFEKISLDLVDEENIVRELRYAIITA